MLRKCSHSAQLFDFQYNIFLFSYIEEKDTNLTLWSNFPDITQSVSWLWFCLARSVAYMFLID